MVIFTSDIRAHVHIRSSNRLSGREEKHHTNKQNPADRNDIDRFSPSSQRIRTLDEPDLMLIDQMRNNDRDIREIERWRRNIEDRNNRLRRPDPNQIEADTKDHNQPNGINRRMRISIDPTPKATQPISPLPHRTTATPTSTYLENGNASSLANAYAILVSASMAEQPVKNWMRMTQNHMIVPPVLPPAFRKICAAGRPVGEARMASKSFMQKQKVMVSIQPMRPETRTAMRMATGPRMAASRVSSDMLWGETLVSLSDGGGTLGGLTASFRRSRSWSRRRRGSCRHSQ